MQLLGGTCKNLKELDICGCGNVSEEGLKYVVTNCRQLDKLSVSFCAYITCKCLSQLSKNFKHLSLNGNEWTPVCFVIKFFTLSEFIQCFLLVPNLWTTSFK